MYQPGTLITHLPVIHLRTTIMVLPIIQVVAFTVLPILGQNQMEPVAVAQQHTEYLRFGILLEIIQELQAQLPEIRQPILLVEELADTCLSLTPLIVLTPLLIIQ